METTIHLRRERSASGAGDMLEPMTAVSSSRHGAVDALPGTVQLRSEVAPPAAYAVFDCETTGTTPGVDEIVSLAVILLDSDGAETGRHARLVRPSCPIPPEVTVLHGIGDLDVADAPRFVDIAHEILDLLAGAVFVAHNVEFDLPMLQDAFGVSGIDYRPAGVACTLDAFRLLEPLADNHRLESLCERRGIVLEGMHDALCDALATAALLRVLLLDENVAPETVELDISAYMRLRSQGDTRPASAGQIRTVFGMARSASLLGPDGGVDRDQVVVLVERIAGTGDVDSLTREQVQDVFDELELLIERRAA